MIHPIADLWRRIAGRPSFAKINDVIFQAAIHSMGIMNADRFSGEENFIRKMLPSLIKSNNPTLLDVGAYEGNYSELLSGSFTTGKIYSFEPNPKTFIRLMSNLRSNATGINKAVGASRGFLDLYDHADSESSEHASLHEGVISSIHGSVASSVKVEVTTIDEFSQEHNIVHIDFLKIDAEGHELQVLKGAEKMIKNNSIGIIQIEFNEMNVVSRVFFRDFVNLLVEYIPFRLLPYGAMRLKSNPLRSEIFAFQNLVFINKKISVDFNMKLS
jgi:FkbM family methyltransferase